MRESFAQMTALDMATVSRALAIATRAIWVLTVNTASAPTTATAMGTVCLAPVSVTVAGTVMSVAKIDDGCSVSRPI